MTDRTPHDMPWMTRLAERWYERRTYGEADLPGARDLADRMRADGLKVSVVLPALDEEETIGAICETIVETLVVDVRLVDELVVIDGGSSDATAAVARKAGARVESIADLVPQVTPVRGKGESLWRSLSTISGDVVAWIDADIRNFAPHFVTRLVAPLVLDEDTAFVKAFYRRPIAQGDELLPAGGGRVTELLARPLLNAFYPELSGILQPLAGEYAGRRNVLEALPFFTGYSVEVGLLIDLLGRVGLDAIAQVDLDERVHRNRPLDELGPMAYAIGRTILRRAEEWGRIESGFDYASSPLVLPGVDGLDVRRVDELERPPLALFDATIAALRETPVEAIGV